MNSAAKVLLIGCGSLLFCAITLFVVLIFWVATTPEGGVKLGNEMDQYALDYIAENDLLNESEEVLAYYDVTIRMDGTEAAMVTTDHVVYHKLGNTTSIPIIDISDINHRQEPFIGDVIEIQAVSGESMKIEIAPMNQGESFLNVLMRKWESLRDDAA